MSARQGHVYLEKVSCPHHLDVATPANAEMRRNRLQIEVVVVQNIHHPRAAAEPRLTPMQVAAAAGEGTLPQKDASLAALTLALFLPTPVT